VEVDVIVKGPQLEKAVNLFTRKLISDVSCADQHSVSACLRLPSREAEAEVLKTGIGRMP
jgi:hypothetical protein